MTLAITSLPTWAPLLFLALMAASGAAGLAGAWWTRTRTDYAPRVLLAGLALVPLAPALVLLILSPLAAFLWLALSGCAFGSAAYYVRSLWVPAEAGVGHEGDVYDSRLGFRDTARELRDPAWRLRQQDRAAESLVDADAQAVVIGQRMTADWRVMAALVRLRIGLAATEFRDGSGIVGLLIGKPESGKTTTAIRYLAGVIESDPNHTIVILDPKGDRALEAAGRALALRHGVPFWAWDVDTPMDPLATNNDQPVPAIVERLMATQEWESDYYRNVTFSAWTDACELLRGAGQPITLDGIVRALSPGGSLELLRAMNLRVASGEADEHRYADLAREHDERSQTRDGWQERGGSAARLRTIARSGLGRYLRAQEEGGAAIHALVAQPGVLYLPLRSAEWPDTSKAIAELMAVLLMQDLGPTALAGHPITLFIDEIGAVPARRLDAILQRGRSAGFSVVLAMQTLASIAADEPQLASQITGTLSWAVVHQVTGQSEGGEDDAERMARLAGTRTQRELTRQTAGPLAMPTGTGSERQVETFIVNPNQLRGLPKGHALVVDLSHPTSSDERVQRVRVERYEPTVKLTPVAPRKPFGLPPG